MSWKTMINQNDIKNIEISGGYCNKFYFIDGFQVIIIKENGEKTIGLFHWDQCGTKKKITSFLEKYFGNRVKDLGVIF